MTRPGSPMWRNFCLLSAAGLTAAMAGCWTMGYSPGGRQASLDEFTYVSTIDYPYTISLIDLSTRQPIWSVDVPVGKELVVRFVDDFNAANKDRPSLMRWRIFDAGTDSGELTHIMPVPDSTSRLLQATIRKGGESMARPENAPPPPPISPAPTPAPAPLPPPESAPAPTMPR